MYSQCFRLQNVFDVLDLNDDLLGDKNDEMQGRREINKIILDQLAIQTYCDNVLPFFDNVKNKEEKIYN